MVNQNYFSHPRKFGKGSRTCRTCGNHRGIVRKYNIMMCRRCFRAFAPDIGFQKLKQYDWVRAVMLYFIAGE